MTTCGDCDCYDSGDDGAGKCKYYAPRPTLLLDVDDDNGYVAWPVVARNERRCGQWRARDCQ